MEFALLVHAISAVFVELLMGWSEFNGLYTEAILYVNTEVST